MNRPSYAINLIPSAADAAILNDSKKYFYTHDFKYTSKGAPSRAHLTVGKFYEGAEWTSMKEALQVVAQQQMKITIPWERVTDEVTKTPNHPDGEGWVSLLFQDTDLHTLFQALNRIFHTYDVNANDDYVNAIRAVKGRHLDTFDCIANHINLCNRCRPEKVAEAKQYIEDRVPKSITFDRLIVRYADADDEDVRLELLLQTRETA